MNDRLTDKDMSIMREADSAFDQSKKPYGVVRDYSLQHRVTMEWDLNEDAKRDKIFKMTVDDKTVILDSEQVMRYLRWV